MTGCICGRSRTDIASFDISNHNKSFFLAVINGFLECDQPGNPELFIHGNLRFYSRNQIKRCIYNGFIKLPDCFCCSFQCFTIFFKSCFLNLLWNIGKHRIQTYANGCMGFSYFLCQFVNHDFSSVIFYQYFLFIKICNLTITDGCPYNTFDFPTVKWGILSF